MSNFSQDLKAEQILCDYLDEIYTSKNYSFVRKSDLQSQYEGVDLYLKHGDSSIAVDEKAQLHYLNKTLPTFAFELSYLKFGQKKSGWLFDKNKKTELYILVRGIYLVDGKSKLVNKSDIDSVTLTCVDRYLLLQYLTSKGLDESTINAYDTTIRASKSYNASTIKELDEVREGKIFFTEYLAEKPINLVLKIDNLVQHTVASHIKT